jgi:hypothetical protein
MNTVHKVLFAAVASAMIFVGDVSAKDGMAEKVKLQFVKNIHNPAAVAGVFILAGAATKEAAGKDYGLTEAGIVGEEYALAFGEDRIKGTLAAMGTDFVLHNATDFANKNETFEKYASYVKADSQSTYGQYVWRTLASFCVGYLVDSKLEK